MMRKFIFLLCLLCGYEANAQRVIDDGAHYGHPVREVVHLLYPMLSVLSRSEISVVRSIEIHIRPGGPWPGPQAGRTDAETRIIAIPERYLAMQHHFIEAVLLADVYGLDHFPEWWTAYVLWRSAPLYDHEIGGIPETPLDFFGLSEQHKTAFYQQYGEFLWQLSTLTLADVILHEIGHHVTNKFYNLVSTPRSVVRQIETEVDAWASDVFGKFADRFANFQYLDRNNLLGRVMAMYFLSAKVRKQWRDCARTLKGN